MWTDLAGLNLYNVLEECHHKQHFHTSKAAKGHGSTTTPDVTSLAALMAQPQQRVWPLTGVVLNGTKLRNWAQLLGHNPPCTQTRWGGRATNGKEIAAWLCRKVKDVNHFVPWECRVSILVIYATISVWAEKPHFACWRPSAGCCCAGRTVQLQQLDWFSVWRHALLVLLWCDYAGRLMCG